MATANPMHATYPQAPPPVSKHRYLISGLWVDVHGIDELPDTTEVSCLWLFHPRSQDQTSMDEIARSVLGSMPRGSSSSPSAAGLIAVSFDQRNHGTRQISSLANETWRDGNETHALDMFSIYRDGTSTDASQLMDHIDSYIFPIGKCKITDHMVLGVSLGGHAAWLSLFHEPRVSAGIVVIGCCDYTSLMYDRARLSKRSSILNSTEQNSTFIGSKDFPTGLYQAVLKFDPASLLLGDFRRRHELDAASYPSISEQERLRPLLLQTLGRKTILNLAGGSDKLVPKSASQPTLRFLKTATAAGGWADQAGITLRDLTFPGVGHEVSHEMALEINDFITSHLSKIRLGVRFHI